MSYANSGSFSSFPNWIPFISFESSLIVMARTSKTILNNSGECGHLYHIPDLRGNAFSFVTTENDVCYEFFVYGLYY